MPQSNKIELSESGEYVGQFCVLFTVTYTTYNYLLFPAFGIDINPLVVFAGTSAAAFVCTMVNRKNGSRWLTS